MIGTPARIIVVDENLSKRLATELSYRGRDAVTVAKLGLRGSADPELLNKLDAQLDDWVLITADDALPETHADVVRAVAATVATINPEREVGWALDPWRREIVHRWAHYFHGQEPGTIRRYGLHRHGRWRERRRRRA